MKELTYLSFAIYLLSLISWPSFAQIQSGPMLGYTDMLETMLWLQTEQEAEVYFEYWLPEEPKRRFRTEAVQTHKENAFIAQCIADKVLPGAEYQYQVYVDQKLISFGYELQFQTQPVWKWRADPPSFKFAFGSCFYTNEEAYDRPGKPYGQNFGILKEILDEDPDFMIWGGDNTYYREVDWNTKTGLIHRQTHTRSLPELQPLLASVHHYAIWDDHDYGPNDSDRSYHLKREALDVFKLFWPNPNYAFEDDAITGSFSWGDCQFFLLDNRWFRAPNHLDEHRDRPYFGEKQLHWLLDELVSSEATFKFVVTGGQIVNPAQVYENMSNYAYERTHLLETIAAENIPGVIFLTGDRHHSCLQRLDRNSYPLYDLTVSPLTSGAGQPHPLEDQAPFVEGTVVKKTQAFSTLEVSGPLEERILEIKVFDFEGKLIWSQQIGANDLKDE